MKNKNSGFFYNLLVTILLFAGCGLLAFGIVWPLWKAATSSRLIYSLVILSLGLIFILFLIVKGMKKAGLKKSLKIFVNFILISAEIIIPVFLVINQKRLIALFVIIIGAVIIAVTNIFWKTNHEN